MPTVKDHILHISGVQQFKACRQAWQWASPLGRNLTPVDKYAPFFIGSLVHHALEYQYRFGITPEQSIAEYLAQNCTPAERQSEKILEQADQAAGLLKHYNLWQRHDQTWLADANFEFIANEQPFRVKLWDNSRKRIYLAGVFDGVVQSKHNGLYYLWEIKTTRSIIEREKQLQLDSQADAYTNAAQRMLGVKISGIVYTLIRKKVPEAPKALKDGTLSQSASQDTSAEWYLAYARNYHAGASNVFLSETYGAFLNTLLAQENKFFRRVVVNRSQYELADSWTQLQQVAREMIDPRTSIYLNESHACNYCLFRAPCIAKRSGRDYEAILGSSYVFNERYADEVSE